MNSLIVCEGKTDAILLGYFLMKVNGFTVTRKPSRDLLIKKSMEKNESFTCYSRGQDNLSIWGVGGKDRFVEALESVYNRLIKYSDEETPYTQIVVVSDRDSERDDSAILGRFSEVFENSEVEFLNRKPVWGIYKDSFGQDKEICTLGLIIPESEDGALETALLESIRADKTDRKIVDGSVQFVSNIRGIASKYIKTDRLELKARLSTVFAIMSPEKVFDFIDELLCNTVKWEESEYLIELFSPIIGLTEKRELI